VRAPLNNPVSPKNYVAYLQDQTVMKKIGAQGEYQGCNAGIYSLFQATGDSMFLCYRLFTWVLMWGRFSLVLADIVWGGAVWDPAADLGWWCGLDMQLVRRSGVRWVLDVFAFSGFQEEGSG
jgi:hypothetical protein